MSVVCVGVAGAKVGRVRDDDDDAAQRYDLDRPSLHPNSMASRLLTMELSEGGAAAAGELF